MVSRKAIDHFERAVEKDPNFALAYALIADCYYLRYRILATALERDGFRMLGERSTARSCWTILLLRLMLRRQ